MLEGLLYLALLLLLLLLLLVLFLILLFIFLFLLCASRLSTRQSKVDGTLVGNAKLSAINHRHLNQDRRDQQDHRLGHLFY